ncbi:hypothetical protein [Thermosynechococcus sp. FA-CM-4201]
MYVTQKNQIRGLSRQEFAALRALCRFTKNLYNVGLYSVRQFFFEKHQHLRYEANYHACKENENYALLNTDIAQQTLKAVDRAFRSFFRLLNKAQQGLYRQVRLPRYLKKDGYFQIPMSRHFKKVFGPVRLPFPERGEEHPALQCPMV